MVYTSLFYCTLLGCFSAFHALWSSLMTHKDDNNDNDDVNQM